MPDSHPLIRLFEAWSAPASAERYRIVHDTTAEAFYYADPHSGPMRDRTAFLGFLTTFQTRLPDGAIQTTGEIDQHETHARVGFTLTRGGAPVRSGVYFADLDADNRVTRLVGFLE